MPKELALAAFALSLSVLPSMAAASDIAAMPVASRTAPPLGYAAMCGRTPEECATDPQAAPEELSAVREWARRAQWTAIFSSTSETLITPAALASTRPPVMTTRDADADRSGPSARRATLAPQSVPISARLVGYTAPGAQTLVLERTDPAEGLQTPAGPVVLGSTLSTPSPAAPAGAPARTEARNQVVAEISEKNLNRVNSRINRSIRDASDYQNYGRADYWAASTENVRRGDCEDYVLAKRRALIDAGVSPAALSIAVVRTRRDEMHAVLLVRTADGEVVLDNLTPWIVGWDRAPYTWLVRQDAGSAFDWVSITAF